MKLRKPAMVGAAILAALALGATACGSSDDGASSGNGGGNGNTQGTTVAPTTVAPASVAPTSDAPRTAPADPYMLGGILPLTGGLSFVVNPIIAAAELAINEINVAGIQTVEFDILDSGTNPEIANNAADEHIAKGAHGILGAISSGISLSIIDKVTQSGIPMISPSNGSTTFTEYPDNGLYFRTTVTDVLKGRVMADLVIETGGEDVAILHRADDYGRAFAEETAMVLEASGANVLQVESYDPEGTSFQAETLSLIESNADSVVLIAFDEGHAILRQMIEADFGPSQINIFIADSLANPGLGAGINPSDPSVAAGIYAINPGPFADAESSFPARFQAANPGSSELITTYTFDAVVVLALAALSAESNDPAVYASHIIEVTRDGEKCVFYIDCAQLLVEGANIDYDGASGPLDFFEAGEPSVGSFDVFLYNDNGFDLIDKKTSDLFG